MGHLYVAGGTYVPSTDGAISNLAVSIDAEITGILNAGETMGLEFIVQQDGTWYTSFLTFVEGIASGWQHIGPVTLTANDFQIKNETGTFAGGPNFTLSGTSLTFGYATWDGNPVGSNGASAVGWGVDNFNVTLNTVPEPSTYALAILGALSLAAFGRRVRCMSNSQRRRVESGMLLLD